MYTKLFMKHPSRTRAWHWLCYSFANSLKKKKKKILDRLRMQRMCGLFQSLGKCSQWADRALMMETMVYRQVSVCTQL